MSKKVAKRNNSLMDPSELTAWGNPTQINRSLLKIPKLLLCQPTSEAVCEGKAVLGDIFATSVNKVVTAFKSGECAEVIPVFMKCLWYIRKSAPGKTKDESEFIGAEAYCDIPGPKFNASLPWEEAQPDGSVIHRSRALILFSLPVIDGEVVNEVHTTTFTGTNFKHGTDIYDIMYNKNTREGLCPAAKIIFLSSTKQKSDKGNRFYATWNVELGEAASKEEISMALGFFNVIKESEQAYTEASVEETTAPTQPAAQPVSVNRTPPTRAAPEEEDVSEVYEEEAKPKARPKRARRAKRRAPAQEEMDIEEEKPKRRPRKTAKKQEETVDEDDLDIDDLSEDMESIDAGLEGI